MASERFVVLDTEIMKCKRRRHLGLRTLGVCLLLSVPGLGQVNVEPLRAKIPDDGIGVAVDAAFNAKSGNTDAVGAEGSGFFGARSEPHLGFVATSGEYARFAGELGTQRAFVHARYAHTLRPWLWAEAFGQLEHDNFSRLTLRRLLGLGPRLRLLSSDTAMAFFATAYMLESEALNIPPLSDDERDTLSHRWSNTATLILTPDERVTVTTTLYFQPRFDEFSDYRLLGSCTTEFAITKLLTAGVAISLRYDSRPPSDVERTDFGVHNKLGLRF